MSKKIWIFLLILFILIYFYIPLVYAGTSEENIVALEKMNKELYNNVKIKEYEKSKMLIEEISNIIPSIKYNGLTSTEGIDAITSTVIQTKRSLAALQPNYEAIMTDTTQLYLAVDALTHKKQPLWHRYYSLINQDINKIKQAIKSNDRKLIQVSINNLQYHYNSIKPAAYVANHIYTIEKLDSLLTALNNQGLEQNKELLLQQLEESFQVLFYGGNKETWGGFVQNTILLKTSLGMALIIFLALSYVTWRKFKAGNVTEQNHPSG